MRAFDTENLEQIKGNLSAIINSSIPGIGKHKKNIYIAGPWFDDNANALMDATEEIVKRVKSPLYNVYFPRSYTKRMLHKYITQML